MMRARKISRVTEIRTERCFVFTEHARQLLEEYYDLLEVVVRDEAEAMQRTLGDLRSGMWVAFVGAEPAGCVVLKGGMPRADAGECKRLYVRPGYRRLGVAEGLMETLEVFAREAGLAWIYLDTNDAFRASVALYEKRGFVACSRYNENPQATLFFRKQLV